MRLRPMDDEAIQLSELQIVQRATAVLPQSTDVALFRISGGAIRVHGLYGEVTTAIASGTNNAKLKHNPLGTGSDVDLCATLDIVSDAVGTVYSITGTLATAMKSTSLWLVAPADDIPAQGLTLFPGDIELDCDASKTGNVRWTLIYRKLEPNATVIAV